MASAPVVYYSVPKVIAAANTVTARGNPMAHTDERNDLLPSTTSRPTRTHRWIAPVLGAVLGLILGTAVVSLAAAYLPEGTSAFSGLGLTLQGVGAVLGLVIGWLIARPQY